MDIHFLIDTFLVPVSIVVGCTLLGMVVDRVVVRWLSALAEKTTWEGDDILIAAVKGLPIVFGVLAACTPPWATPTLNPRSCCCLKRP